MAPPTENRNAEVQPTPYEKLVAQGVVHSQRTHWETRLPPKLRRKEAVLSQKDLKTLFAEHDVTQEKGYEPVSRPDGDKPCT